MANIVLTSSCNLRCPYCFAYDAFDDSVKEISEENFLKAADFILTSSDSVGLIGGEPLVCSNFNRYVDLLLMDERVNRIMVYTNGVLTDNYIELFMNKKVELLINCNSVSVLGQENYSRVCKNIDLLAEHDVKFGLGYNFYGEDYKYIIDLCRKYDLHELRFSYVVPCSVNTGDRFSYFMNKKQELMDFLKCCLMNNILPNFDCNKLPTCLFTEGDIEALDEACDDPYLYEKFVSSTISNNVCQCRPVIDIYPDLSCLRCFGLANETKKMIADYDSLENLVLTYIAEVDMKKLFNDSNSRCRNCENRLLLKCYGGCLKFIR